MPFFIPSLAKQRLYTTPSFYATFLVGIVTGKLKPGAAMDRLEGFFRERFGVHHALGVNQARVGLYLAIQSIIAHSGRKQIILSPYTIHDIVNMVICAGGIPVFADIEAETCNINPAEIEALIDDQTAAVLVTHLHGLACDMEKICAICRQKGVFLIEDAAQALGVHLKGQPLGTFGDVGVFSFGRMKNVSGLFGGMVITQDKNLYERMKEMQSDFPTIPRQRLVKRAIFCLALDLATLPILFRLFTFWIFRNQALSDTPFLKAMGHSEDNPQRLDLLPAVYRQAPGDVQASIVFPQLEKIEENNRKRIVHATIYHHKLQGIQGVRLPPLRDDGSHTYMVFPIQVKDRSTLLRTLMLSGRECAAQHMHNCADLPCFKPYFRDCPQARRVSQETLLLPTYPRYGQREVEKNAQVVRRFFTR